MTSYTTTYTLTGIGGSEIPFTYYFTDSTGGIISSWSYSYSSATSFTTVTSIITELVPNFSFSTFTPLSTISSTTAASSVITSSTTPSSTNPPKASDSSLLVSPTTTPPESVVSLTNPSKSNPTSITPPLVQSPSSARRISAGTIAGIAIGTVALLILLATLAFFLIRRKQKHLASGSRDFPPELGDTRLIELDPESEKKRGELEGGDIRKRKELDGNDVKIVPIRTYKGSEERSELEAAEIRGKPVSKEIKDKKVGEKVAGWEMYENQETQVPISMRTRQSDNSEYASVHRNETDGLKSSPRKIIPSEEYIPPKTQVSSGPVDEELLWLEQEEARMKESQARFQERKAQILAQKRAGAGASS